MVVTTLLMYLLLGQKNLRVLNAAYNKVSDLSKLEGCVRLEKLLLEGNEVMSLDSLPELPKLRQLSLRVGSEGLNPVYEGPQYSSPEAAEADLLRIVFERFPTVFLFNGAHTVRLRVVHEYPFLCGCTCMHKSLSMLS